MTAMRHYGAMAGLAVALAYGDSAPEGAATQSAERRPPPAPVDMCTTWVLR